MVYSSPSQRQRNWGIESKVLRVKVGRHEYRLARTRPGHLITSSENVSEGIGPPSYQRGLLQIRVAGSSS